MSEPEAFGAHVARMDRSLAEKTFEDKAPTSDARARGADQMPSRVRLVGLLAVPAFFVAAIAAWFIARPDDGLAVRFYRFDVIPLVAVPIFWTAAVVLCFVCAPRLSRYRKWVWQTFVAVVTLVAVPLWMLTAFIAAWSDDDGNVEDIVVSPDGGHEAVAVPYYAFDSGCHVWLRERGGLFSRQALVWVESEGPCPAQMSFIGDNTISITELRGGKTLTTTFDPDRTSVAAVLYS
ncbi:hypothetical protein [Nocardia sp. CS682]|uniref:hypothetical protein n=1 Tax=Nocardia sp. CS682 TaxID=1047172 RepID=UPI0010750031|nr:hypothetical protein [Nocardia sp. CS682]